MIINRAMSPLTKLAVILLVLPIAALASDKPRPAPPVKPAVEYPVNDPHPQEKVTVAADPCEREEDCKFFRLPYSSHGFLPVRVIITNDRDQPLELDEVRIQFFPSDGSKQAAASDDDLNRRLFKGKDAAGTKLPIIPITIHHQPVDQKIINDGTDFGFASTTVPPHSTRAGYVFYDVRGIDDPVMKHAEVYVKMIRTTDDKGAKLELFAFTLSLDKYLAAHSEEPAPKK